MQTVPTDIIQRFLFAKCGDTLDGRYVKIQDGWSCSAKKIDEDGTNDLTLYYKVCFRDLTDDQFYSTGQVLQALSLSENGYRIICKHPFGDYQSETISVEHAWMASESYPHIYSEKPAG